MTNNTNFKRYTGKTFVKFTLFGAVFRVECVGTWTDWHDLQESPEFTYWRKMTDEDLTYFNITLKQ